MSSIFTYILFESSFCVRHELLPQGLRLDHYESGFMLQLLGLIIQAQLMITISPAKISKGHQHRMCCILIHISSVVLLKKNVLEIKLN